MNRKIIEGLNKPSVDASKAAFKGMLKGGFKGSILALACARAWAEQAPLPVQVEGQKIEGQSDLQMEVTGDAVVSRGGLRIEAQSIRYDRIQDKASATGNVVIDNAGKVFHAQSATLRTETGQGELEKLDFDLGVAPAGAASSSKGLRSGGYGEAAKFTILDQDLGRADDVSYSMCRRLPGPSWLQDWYFKADRIDFDEAEDTAYAHNARLRFKGVSVFGLPYMELPLSGRRRSGWLPPTVGTDPKDGVSLGLPYYWNIAPNRDATLTPILMLKRGSNLHGALRYLEQDYGGEWRAHYLPSDKLKGGTRWALNVAHRHELPWAGDDKTPPITLAFEHKQVSDDDYWKDFPHTLTAADGRLLPSSFSATWQNQDWRISAGTQRWQTLKDRTTAATDIVPPYEKLPQIQIQYQPRSAEGVQVSALADYTLFRAGSDSGQSSNGQRGLAQFGLSYPVRTMGWYVVPKLQWQSRLYRLDQALPSSAGAFANQKNLSVNAPTVSLDAGLNFERDLVISGRSIQQTLEPRLFYTNTPYRAQNHLPNYDAASYDYSFPSIFNENSFSGYDRLADNHAVTLGIGSQWWSQGQSLARINFAQRLRLSDQDITLPGASAEQKGASDMLMEANWNWGSNWTFDAFSQFNPSQKRTVRSVLGASYHPSNYRVLSLAYRLQRGSSEQYELGWQWPLNDIWGDKGKDQGPGRGLGDGRWYTVGRVNYDRKESKVADALLGLEYDAGCWVSRFVAQRLQLGTSQQSTRYMVQLELVGLSKINLGSNPLTVLKNQIPRYQFLHDQ